MTEQVDRVLNPPGPCQRAAVDRHPKRLRQRLTLCRARGALAYQRHRALQQQTIQLVLDHPVPERLQCSLGEGRLARAETVQRHLPAQVHDRELDRFRIRCADVSLEENNHAQHRGRVRRISGSRLPVRALKRLLECVVEHDVPADPQEPEQRPHSGQALHQQLLLLRQIDPRLPTFHAHLVSHEIIRAARCRSPLATDRNP